MGRVLGVYGAAPKMDLHKSFLRAWNWQFQQASLNSILVEDEHPPKNCESLCRLGPRFLGKKTNQLYLIRPTVPYRTKLYPIKPTGKTDSLLRTPNESYVNPAGPAPLPGRR